MTIHSKNQQRSKGKDLQTIIYTRFSSDLQSNKSCIDQEREVREALSRMQIDCSQATVIHDEAESGTKVFRDEFSRLDGMVRSGLHLLLVVDDQARLSRADNTFAFITDLVYAGGRFLSTGEGIDTEQPGWELRVKVMELHNSTTIRELGRRVRRGQLGRVLANLSSGDLCYGYESYLLNPDQPLSVRGPKPEKAIRIKGNEADWVIQIFKWFNEHRSIAWIVEQLNLQNAPSGNRRKSSRWRHVHVRKMLSNMKYVGIWQWGTTRTMRNSQGKTKQVPVPRDKHIVVQRPDLRIIKDEEWETAQHRLAYLKDQYGVKPGQRNRGPKVHHTELYPADLLSGLVFCRRCGRRLWKTGTGRKTYLCCPNKGKVKGSCDMFTLVPLAVAEIKILEAISEILTSSTEWLQAVTDTLYQKVEELGNTLPIKVESWRKEHKEVIAEIDNLADGFARSRQSQALLQKLHDAEKKAEQLEKKIGDATTQFDAH
jgi:site-specific DNA recombinase